MTFQEAIKKATEKPQYYSAESTAIDRLTHAIVAIAYGNYNGVD